MQSFQWVDEISIQVPPPQNEALSYWWQYDFEIKITNIGVRAGGARGAAAPPQILGNSGFLGSERNFGQNQFLKTFPCFLNLYFEEINIFYFNLKLA